ncbi:MAG: hypothetical protein RR405_04940, partial [Clostridia bacterium]
MNLSKVRKAKAAMKTTNIKTKKQAFMRLLFFVSVYKNLRKLKIKITIKIKIKLIIKITTKIKIKITTIKTFRYMFYKVLLDVCDCSIKQIIWS